MMHGQRARNTRFNLKLMVPALPASVLPVICLVATLALWVDHITMCEEMLISLRCFNTLLVRRIRDLLPSPTIYPKLCVHYNQDLRYSIEISPRVLVMTPENATLPQDAIQPPV